MSKKITLYLIVHNVSSPQRLVDVARIVFNKCSPFNYLIVSKPTGMAAQVGLPDVSRMSYKLNRNLIITSSIKDALDLIDAKQVYLINFSDVSELIYPEDIELSDKTAIVVSGSDTGFTKSELALGKPIHIAPFTQSLGAVAEVTLLTYGLAKKLKICQG